MQFAANCEQQGAVSEVHKLVQGEHQAEFSGNVNMIVCLPDYSPAWKNISQKKLTHSDKQM